MCNWIRSGDPNITFPNSVTQAYTLTGPDISYVVFFDNVENFAGVHLALDDLTLTGTPLPAALPLFASGLGALGLLGSAQEKESSGTGCLIRMDF